MRYSLNYEGAIFADDSDGFNCHYYDSFDDAYSWLYTIVHSGHPYAYLRDEKFGVTLSWDRQNEDFYWA